MKWNKVTEKLPEKPKKWDEAKVYFVKYENGNVQALMWADGWNCYYMPDWTVCRKHEINGVIAWIDPDDIED